ncbi:unnamed protein product [Rhizophagus irregularis]|uniref:Uncharacterized protein n=1 Tax=Rhizophagus irregularis TaxID=588596 RepID=A0A2N1NBK4_9GLOM|nr:hypothetical protein RhiirC2_849332 [Rhizophagus irregularis]CAB4383906.1 unnamed protein product [Rhizophagus irregularis]CAB5353923.1 unnamed protein product [Rhizophagus irregularis]
MKPQKASNHIMFQKLLIIFAIVILILSPTFTYSANDIIKYDISGSSFYCQDGTSRSCCSQLAHRVSSDHHSRCASIVLTNKSGYNMDLVAKNLEDGRWLTSEDYVGGNSVNINCEPHSLLDNESETISSVTGRFLGGLTGYVSFKINDDMTNEFTISWKVPTIGSPQYEFNFLNDTSNQHYDVKMDNVFENTVYQITINNKDNKDKTFISSIMFLVIIVLVIIVIFAIVSCCNTCRQRFRPGPPAGFNTRVIPGPPVDFNTRVITVPPAGFNTRRQHSRPGPPAGFNTRRQHPRPGPPAGFNTREQHIRPGPPAER